LESELIEEDVGERLIVVLPGVDEKFFVLLAQDAAERGRLDELGPGPDDRCDLHGEG